MTTLQWETDDHGGVYNITANGERFVPETDLPDCKHCASKPAPAEQPDAPPDCCWSDPVWVAANLRVGDVFGYSSETSTYTVIAADADTVWSRPSMPKTGVDGCVDSRKRLPMAEDLLLISRAEQLPFEQRLHKGCKVRHEGSKTAHKVTSLCLTETESLAMSSMTLDTGQNIGAEYWDDWELVEESDGTD